MSRWFSHGKEIHEIAINDRGLQYGDGLFETIAVRGGQPRLWNLHMERLQTGCQRLAIKIPDVTGLLQQISAAILLALNTGDDGLLKIIVTRGEGKRGYAPPADAQASVLVGIFERREYPDHYYQKGIEVRICNARLSLQPQTAGIKLLSRLDQVRACSEWQDPGIAEGLMLDQSGGPICGTTSNLFMVRNGGLCTPELTHCGVSGVMRRHILSLADQYGVPCEVTAVSMDMLLAADEIFMCNSQFGIWPVSRCGGKLHDSWPVTQKLRTLLRQSGVIEGPA